MRILLDNFSLEGKNQYQNRKIINTYTLYSTVFLIYKVPKMTSLDALQDSIRETREGV